MAKIPTERTQPAGSTGSTSAPLGTGSSRPARKTAAKKPQSLQVPSAAVPVLSPVSTPTVPTGPSPVLASINPVAPTSASAPNGVGGVQGNVVPVPAHIQAKVHQLMSSPLGTSLTPEQLLGHVYGANNVQLQQLPEHRQVLKVIHHLQHQRFLANQFVVPSTNASHAQVGPCNNNNGPVPFNTVLPGNNPQLVQPPILPTSQQSPSSLQPQLSAQQQQQFNHFQQQQLQRSFSMPVHAMQSQDDLLNALLGQDNATTQFNNQTQLRYTNSNNQLQQQFQPMQQQAHLQMQQPSFGVRQQHQVLNMQPQQPPRAIEAPRQQPQQQYQQQQNHPQPQSQSNFNQELASLRNQMTHMQHYITQLVQNQAQMNSQISQLFARNQQLVKSLTAAGSAPAPGHVLTTSPGPISPPISQNTPLDSSVVKSPPTASALTPFTMQRTSTPASTETSAAPNASVTAAGDGNNNEVPVLSDDAFDQFFQI